MHVGLPLTGGPYIITTITMALATALYKMEL